MILQPRDISLVKDVSLSHVLSRNQVINLGYFSTVTRANTRLRELVKLGYLAKLATPFMTQHLYVPGKKAPEIVDYRIANLIRNRGESPRFIQHALNTTNVRISLIAKGATDWRFEQQLWRKLEGLEVRPDGLAITTKLPMFIEIDLGHVSPQKFKSKLLSYEALAVSGQCQSLYGFDKFRLLTITTGSKRAKSLSRLLPNPSYDHLVQTFADLGVVPVGAWS
ncbi:MAG: replication-relaxation family protein [Armatimonadota bacterium]